MIGVIINDTQTITFEEAAEVASKRKGRKVRAIPHNSKCRCGEREVQAASQPQQRCLSCKAGIVRCCLRRTKLSSTLCVRLRPSAGWLQESPCRRFLLPPAFHFAGAGMLPRSGLGNRSSLRSSRSAPAGACPVCGRRYPLKRRQSHGRCYPAPT